jgi:hypothetical protein
MNGATVIWTTAACLLVASMPSVASDDYSWRATVTSERARRIAGELFPEKCHGSGEACAITYDDRRACPFEFVVIFPGAERGPGEPPAAWVTLDKNGAVVDVSTNKSASCRDVRT